MSAYHRSIQAPDFDIEVWKKKARQGSSRRQHLVAWLRAACQAVARQLVQVKLGPVSFLNPVCVYMEISIVCASNETIPAQK